MPIRRLPVSAGIIYRLQLPYRQTADGAVRHATASPARAWHCPAQDSMADANADMAGAIAIKPDIPEEFIRTGLD